MDLGGIAVIQQLRGLAACGHKLWPLYNTMLSPWGWKDGGWLAGWTAGWMWWASPLYPSTLDA